jgi:hypothetical protein
LGGFDCNVIITYGLSSVADDSVRAIGCHEIKVLIVDLKDNLFRQSSTTTVIAGDGWCKNSALAEHSRHSKSAP